MKKILTTFILCLLAFNGISQKIAENKVDEFKGTSIVRTDWELLMKKGSAMAYNLTTVKYRFSKIDGEKYLDIKLVLNQGEVFAVREGFELIFLFEDGTTSTFNAVYDVVASEGGGATGFAGSALYGANIPYKGNFSDLLEKTIQKIRIYTDEGYVENDVKSKDSKLVAKSVELIEKTVAKGS